MAFCGFFVWEIKRWKILQFEDSLIPEETQ
jgi:hypothetical protein